MRGFLPAGFAVASAISAIAGLAPLAARASSLDYVHTPPDAAPSVTIMHCTDCPALKPDPRAVTYVVPELVPGTDRSEIKEINGEMKIVREEAWLGGSPVTFISKASDEDVRLARGEPAHPAGPATVIGEAGRPAPPEGGTTVTVDKAMTTASLGGTTAASIAAVSVAPSDPASASSSSQAPSLALSPATSLAASTASATPSPTAADTASSSSHDFDGQSLQLRLN
ncbi:hypothetical protein ASG25_04155 [Rhizobium sp. Leaf384]|uniref:plant virulence effector HPE1-like domain-containing protein n=1 Tax=unclassified Rhizobium TaxID=2613769 RepID=UPI000712E820|nr:MULTISPECIES: plant virulence effector HPE1-like domain-containing protein [unclassified Rhizobium]KQS77347.1 hypothetical protein ASG58_10170 [Rhizobium sp. Leaf383]KQS80744.1 hypothetical protein ASG25_04155 [Rhizobium sp. Leaf384]